MQILFLIPVIFLCLFILYLLARHDFVLLRQNISLAQVFDLGLISLFFAFLTSRIFFIINNANFELLNILSFLHILRYPGFSALGFLIGGIVALFFLFRRKKGLRRIFDIFAISFLPVFAYYFLLQGYPAAFFYIPLLCMIVLTVLFFFFIKAHGKYMLRDGSISYLIVFLICINIFTAQFFNENKWNILFNFSAAQLISLIFIIATFILTVLNQKLFKS